MEASRAEPQGYLTPSRLTPGEFMGMFAALVLVASLWLPWFKLNGENSELAGKGPNEVGETVTAWQTFPLLRWLLIAACVAPFILTWIVARGHKLTWKPGEVTMIVGITALVLILCNGIILGRPGDSVDIGLTIGYFVGLLAAAGLFIAGYLRQAIYEGARKPPGVL